MYCISLSFKRAPIEVREKFAFSKLEEQAFYSLLMAEKEIGGLVILSTCNRTELYFTGGKQAIYAVEQALAFFKSLPLSKIRRLVMIFEGERAVSHLYCVASGLDSMVIGEDEILGQVKKAYQNALKCHATDTMLNIIFQGAIGSAKKVKEATGLSKTSISIGTLVAHEIFHFEKAHEKKKVLIIGMTGKIGTIIMKNIYQHQDIEVIGTVRQHGGTCVCLPKEVRVVAYHQRYQYLDEADIIISATTSPHYTLTYDAAIEVIKTKKKRLFIDLAVPMDIDRSMSLLEGAIVRDIDHFKQLAKRNNELKLQAVEQGKVLLEEAVEDTQQKIFFNKLIKKEAFLNKLREEKSMRQLLVMIRNIADQKMLKQLLELVEKLEEFNEK